MKNIVIIPGVFGGLEQFQDMTEIFRKAGYMPWLPEYWRDTEPLPANFLTRTIDDRVECVLSLIKEIPPGNLYFLVHSMGIIILSRVLARLTPEVRQQVKKAVIVSPTVALSPMAKKVLARNFYQDLLANNQPFHLLVDDILNLFFNGFGFHRSWVEKMASRFTTPAIIGELATPQELSLGGIPGMMFLPEEDRCHKFEDQYDLSVSLSCKVDVFPGTSHVEILGDSDLPDQVVEFFDK